MEDSTVDDAFGPGMPTKLSAGSLDLKQLIGANQLYSSSLLSESATCASLASSSGTLPSFPIRVLPNAATVALGEHLKMFPAVMPTIPRVLLASPTSPRLRSMCKECLSITKWAQYSTGCDPPGHVPWESVLECNNQKWLPEGSLFSPESFSQALSRARSWRPDKLPFPQTHDHWQQETYSLAPSSSFRKQDDNADILDMMRELQSLRSYFEATLRDDLDRDVDPNSCHIVPRLVVSTSHVTFPLNLDSESSQNLARYTPSVISSRRGKEPQAESITSTKSYRDIPTASPGLQMEDDYPDHPPGVSSPNHEKSALCVQEMISNLRLQCSTMSPTNDTSWNSRSPLASLANIKPAKKPDSALAVDEDFSKTLIKSSSASGRRSSSTIGLRLQGKVNPSTAVFKRTPSTDVTGSRTSKYVSSKPISKRQGSQKMIPLPRDNAKDVPCSAMVKGNAKRPLKSVRFVLPQSEIEKELFKLNRELRVTEPASNTKDPLLPPKYISRTLPVATSFGIKDSVLSAESPTPSVPPPTKARAQSVSVTSPFRKIALARGSVELKTSKPESTMGASPRRSHTTGCRHSLNRIIKGPMFSKETKRATISIDPSAFEACNENRPMVREDGLQNNSKKHRMPVQFRSLLTRFK